MPDFLAENPATVYLVLGTFAVIFLVAYWVTRKKRFLIGVGAMAALGGIVWLIDFLVVTDHEQIVASVEEMANGVRAKDANRIFGHVSDEFRLGGLNKAGLRSRADGILARGDLQDVRVWDFQHAEINRPAADRPTATIVFKFKPIGNVAPEDTFYRCRANFVLEADGKWRMTSFEIFNPFVDTERPMQIPQLQ
jgi:hypothetical protein